MLCTWRQLTSLPPLNFLREIEYKDWPAQGGLGRAAENYLLSAILYAIVWMFDRYSRMSGRSPAGNMLIPCCLRPGTVGEFFAVPKMYLTGVLFCPFQSIQGKQAQG